MSQQDVAKAGAEVRIQLPGGKTLSLVDNFPSVTPMDVDTAKDNSYI